MVLEETLVVAIESRSDSTRSLRRLAWAALAWCSIGAGTAGVFLPLLPTTPFLLFAAWAGSRASPRFERWLYHHPRFGPSLRAWEQEGAIATRAKLLATLLMSLSWVLLWLLNAATLMLVTTAVLFSGLLIFLWSRPRPHCHRSHS